MKRNQLSMLAAVGAASPLERAKLRLFLCFSARARKRHAEYQRVGVLFAAALGAEDDLIAVRVKPRRGLRMPKAPVLVLLGLLGVILLEWGAYTLPRSLELIKDLAHSCGLR
jgi:hypothetical protein